MFCFVSLGSSSSRGLELQFVVTAASSGAGSGIDDRSHIDDTVMMYIFSRQWHQ